MFKSFDDIDAAGDISFSAESPSVGAVADAEESAKKAAAPAEVDPSVYDTFVAAFQRENTIGSVLSRKDTVIDNDDDGDFDPVKYVRDHGLTGDEDAFMGVMNVRRADAVREQLAMERENKRILDSSGLPGVAASLAAGVLDLPILIPGGAAVQGARGAWAVGASALRMGAMAGVGAAASEAALQASQISRPVSESAVNVGGAVVLGSMMGGAMAAVLSKNERIAAERALSVIGDVNSGKTPNTPQSVGAAVAEGAFVDVAPEDVARTVAELSVEGKSAAAVARVTSWFNPVLRSTQRYSSVAGQVASELYESTIYRAMHSAGGTTGVSVEAASRTRVTALLAQAGGQAEVAYKDMRKGGVRLSRDDFYSQVGNAMRNSDESDNPFVARAAQAYRKMFDEFTNDALKLGLIDESDLDVKTAASYLSRVYDRDRLNATEPQFLDVIGRVMAERMSEAYREDAAAMRRVLDRHAQRTADMSLSGEARVSAIATVKAEGDALDAKNAHLQPILDDLSDARARSRDRAASDAERAAAREEMRQIRDRGGAELSAYLDARAGLRERMRNLSSTSVNADAMAARAGKLARRIDTETEAATASVRASARRMKNMLNKLASDPVGRAEYALDAWKAEAARLQKAVAASAKRVEELNRAPGEQPPALAEYWKQRRAESVALAEKAGALLDELDALGAAGVSTDELRAVAASIGEGSPGREARASRAKARGAALAKKLGSANETVAKRAGAVDRAEAAVSALNDLFAAAAEQSADVAMRRGERVAKLKDAAAKLTPDEIAAAAKAAKDTADRVAGAAEDRFNARWGARKAVGLEAGEPYPFAQAGRDAAKEVYDKITGKVAQRDDVPTFITKVTSGPLKDRTFNVPDALLVDNGWLKSDVREIAHKYARAMAGEVELTRRFGKATMEDQLARIAKDYSDLRVAVENASSVQEINTALGREKYGPGKDLAAAKLDAQKVLSADERSAITDMKAGRDLIRGTYNSAVNSGDFASVTRSLLSLNYIRVMGGALLSNVSDFYRPAMVHGLSPYLRTMPKLMAHGFGIGSDGVRMSVEEAKLAGLVVERVTHSLMAASGDIADPFLTRTTHVERLLQKATSVASRWNLVNVFTDAQHAIASTLSQHRVIEAVLGNGGKPGSMADEGTRLLRMLGIDSRTQADMARYLAEHGELVDGIRVAHTEDWLRAARAAGDASEIDRAEKAVRTYRAAINTDVNSIVSRRGLGDAPLFAHHPVGRVLTQFSGFTMGAHSRVMIRGLQESPTRLVGGLVAMTALGSLTAMLSAWRGGKDRWEKYSNDIQSNPAVLIADGLDRSGLFPLLFDVSNRVERATGAMGQNYKFNPVKTPVAMLGGGAGLGYGSGRAGGQSGSGFSSDTAMALGAVAGPSIGLVDSALATGRVAADALYGRKPPKSDVNSALAGVPFQSYYGMRELLQVLSGNSNYVGD